MLKKINIREDLGKFSAQNDGTDRQSKRTVWIFGFYTRALTLLIGVLHFKDKKNETE